jgi:hypothetical protein
MYQPFLADSWRICPMSPTSPVRRRSPSRIPLIFLASRDLASLHLDMIPMTGYISPEAILASLAVLTRLESLRMGFPFWKPYPEQRTGDRDPPIRVVLPLSMSWRCCAGGSTWRISFPGSTPLDSTISTCAWMSAKPSGFPDFLYSSLAPILLGLGVRG